MISEQENKIGLDSLAEERQNLVLYLVQNMEKVLSDDCGVLAEASLHVVSNPGKLLRPMLLLDACRAVGGDPAVAFPAAAGTEYGQIASLIHDDIIDGDDQRRGLETLHVKYNLATAILTGDLLLFQLFLSYTECAERGAKPENILQAIRILSKTCIEMCEGQALEATLIGKLDTSEETYLRMIELKTASVFGAAAKIGACLGDASPDTIEALGSYGSHLGMAFQIVDDLLSIQGDPEVVGKPLGSDLRNRRVTLPIIYALRSGDSDIRASLVEVISGNARNGKDPRENLLEIVQRSGGLDLAFQQAQHYIATATDSISFLPESKARTRLMGLADFFLSRDR